MLRHCNHRHRVFRCLGKFETLRMTLPKKKALAFDVFKSFILQVHRKKTKYFNCISITSDVQRKIPKLFKRIKTSFRVLHIKVLSFKGISCSMNLIVHP